MTLTKRSWKWKSVTLCLGLATWVFLSAPGVQATAARPIAWTPGECEQVASIGRTLAENSAYMDALETYAKCLSAGDPLSCLPDILSDLQDALDEADDIHGARIDLCGMIGSGPYAPNIDPNEFSTTIDNIYRPMPVGQRLIYEKQTPEGEERIVVEVLDRTIDIDGVECRVVQDRAYLDGVLIEDTDDYFVQHANGDVWYFGEISRNYEDGLLTDLDGSWKHGEDGAVAGVLVHAVPVIGTVHRQEFYFNEAEDVAEVVATGQTVTVPAGTFTNCLQTKEWTPLEPDGLEYKYYAPGVGVVLEVDPESGERLELVRIN